MKIYQFPHQYEAQLKQKTQSAIYKERTFSQSRIRTIHENATFDSADTLIWSSVCGTIGFIIGFFACCGVGEVTDSGGAAFGTWITVSIIGSITGNLIAKGINSRHKNLVEESVDEIKREESRCESVIKKIENDVKRESDLYKSEFEAEAQKMSVRYAESKLATEVIDWMSKGFSKTIDVSDRRSHIEKISVPFSFKVYSDKISCPLGTYDFEIKRCANLNSPLEQTALARAIASSIQLNITMKYPKDASGTDFVLDIAYSYSENYVSISIIYSAPNGNYKPVKQW